MAISDLIYKNKRRRSSDLDLGFLIRGRSQTTLTRFWLFFLTTYPPALTVSIGRTLTKRGNFWTPYLPRLVNVVCERPLSKRWYCSVWWEMNECTTYYVSRTRSMVTCIAFVRFLHYSRLYGSLVFERCI